MVWLDCGLDSWLGGLLEAAWTRTGDWVFPGRHLGPDFGFWRARYGLLLESAGADWVGGTGRLWG